MVSRNAPKVLIAMSGGVDSSVAAALLAQQGYDVTGVTLRLLPEGPGTARSVFAPCCTLAAVEDARQAADRIGIPHLVLNYADLFEKEVVADFADEYRAGRTPNPCVRCNQRVKFGALAAHARELGAEFVATGHYARVSRTPPLSPRERGGEGGRYVLRRGVDAGKDQSYALACLSQEQLARALFPLGHQTKAQTRETARALGLVAAERPESQEICFVPDNDYRRFLTERFGPPQRGPILSTQGEVLGEHKGLPFYTLGQRKGLGIAAPRPYYVIRLDIERNAVIVGHEDETFSDGLTAREVNWTSVAPRTEPFEAQVQVRYRHTAAPATVIPVAAATSASDRSDQSDRSGVEGLVVRFHEPQRALTPGQWAVAYDGDCVLAAGIINKLIP